MFDNIEILSATAKSGPGVDKAIEKYGPMVWLHMRDWKQSFTSKNVADLLMKTYELSDSTALAYARGILKYIKVSNSAELDKRLVNLTPSKFKIVDENDRTLSPWLPGTRKPKSFDDAIAATLSYMSGKGSVGLEQLTIFLHSQVRTRDAPRLIKQMLEKSYIKIATPRVDETFSLIGEDKLEEVNIAELYKDLYWEGTEEIIKYTDDGRRIPRKVETKKVEEPKAEEPLFDEEDIVKKG